MQVEGQHDDSLLLSMATGARVSNAYPTFPLLGDNLAKVRLIPYDVLRRHLKRTKDLSATDGDASDQVVGGVTAHQAYDQ